MVRINGSQQHLFNRAHLASVHLIKDQLRFLVPVKKYLYRKIGKTHKSAMYYDFDEKL